MPCRDINLVHFGKDVNHIIKEMAPMLAPLRIETVTFQPRRTEVRIRALNRSLVLGILIVAGVLISIMGIRLGLMVALVVPMVTMVAVAIFAWGGGVLHQISIAAFVLALGMLVDNAIVVAENIQWRLDSGQSSVTASTEAIQELAVPLAGATATTIAAFTPMIVSQGPTAIFTRSIPVIVMITLTVSYLFAIFVTPVFSQIVLRPVTISTGGRMARIGQCIAKTALQKRGWVLGGAALLVAFSLWAADGVKQQFFPSADRNQFILEIELAEGAHLSATYGVSLRFEKMLLMDTRIQNVASFIGRSVPHFYYNIDRIPFSPHFAQLIVETNTIDDVLPVMASIREFAAEKFPGTRVVTRKLEQGTPVKAPVEVRLLGKSLADLRRLVTVSAQLTDGYTYSQILEKLVLKLETGKLPDGVDLVFGGDAEGAGEANAALVGSFPLGILLLLGILMAEFNSFCRTLIILITVPLAAAGVVPGLLIADQPFGFMSLLGVIALIGIVVNNAIVLLEAVEDRRKAGKTVSDALQDAVTHRLRPILLTTITTVAGLMPLATSPSTLWPPLASAMISGLLASTLLTLMVVPALYSVLFSPLSCLLGKTLLSVVKKDFVS